MWDETPDSLAAGTCAGVENEKLPEVLESLKNAAKDIVRPQGTYQYRSLEGPVETIGLSSNRSVVVVHTPEGEVDPENWTSG